jgi:hypothetical protein
MWTIINQLYGSNIGCGSESTVLDIVTPLFAIEQQISEWERQLPSFLDQQNISNLIHLPESVTETHTSVDRFRIILKLRQHNVRILLHRPILVKFLDVIGKSSGDIEIQEASLMQQIGSNSLQICAQSSMDIITTVRTIVEGNGHRRSLLGAWWFSLYYTFNAALVVFASLLVLRDQKAKSTMPLPLRISELELRRSLTDASQALRHLDCENRMVDRCAAYLEQLSTLSEVMGKSFYFILRL